MLERLNRALLVTLAVEARDVSVGWMWSCREYRELVPTVAVPFIERKKIPLDLIQIV